jgi:hypothetical protein
VVFMNFQKESTLHGNSYYEKMEEGPYSFAQLKYKFLIYFNSGGFRKRRGTSSQPLKKPTATANENKYFQVPPRQLYLQFFD